MKRYGATEGKAAERGKAKRKSKGCFDFTSRTFLLDNIKYSACVGNYTLSGLGYYYEVLLNYEKGLMPFTGALSLQPNKIMEVIHLIETIKNDKKEG